MRSKQDTQHLEDTVIQDKGGSCRLKSRSQVPTGSQGSELLASWCVPLHSPLRCHVHADVPCSKRAPGLIRSKIKGGRRFRPWFKPGTIYFAAAAFLGAAFFLGAACGMG